MNVSRQALLERLRTSPARVLSIVAPAGYGKTMLARQFIATYEGHAICDCIDVTDVGDLASRLIRCLAIEDQQRAARAASEQSAAIGTNGDALAMAAAAWSDAPGPAIVLLDNAEWIIGIAHGMPFLRQLVLGHRRPIVFCSRRTIELPFGHGIGPEDVTMIGSCDLAFTRAEASSLLGEPSQRDLDRTMTLTEGWPLAVAMIARMSGSQSLDAVLELIGKCRSEELSEYLMTQFLGDLKTPALKTLIAVAAIPRPTVSELSTMLETDCSDTLEELCKSLPMSSAAGTIDIHPLLREMLRHRFSQQCAKLTQRTIRSAARARDHTRVAELQIVLGDQHAAAAALQEAGPHALTTPSPRVSNVLASLDDSVLIDFPMVWCASMLYRGYAIPPEEWLRNALAIWTQLDPKVDRSIRTSVASCVLHAYTNLGRFKEARDLLVDFRGASDPEDLEAVALVKLWGAGLDSFAGRYADVEETAREFAPVLAASPVTHALYLYDVMAPMYRSLGQRSLEYCALERAIELVAASNTAVFSIVVVEAAFSAWFAGDDREFARYLFVLEASIMPSIARGHSFFILCARGSGFTATPSYEKVKARVEALLIATSLATTIGEARILASRALEVADACGRPFYRVLARLAWAEVDADRAAALRAEACVIGSTVEAEPFRSAVEAVAADRPDLAMLAAFVSRFERFSRRDSSIELRLFDGVLAIDRSLILLGDADYALLVALAREDRWHSGEELASALFAELDESTAKNRVYVCLHRLRKRFGEARVVVAGRRGYRLAQNIVVDVWQVESLLARANAATARPLTERERLRLSDVASRPSARRPLPQSLEQPLLASHRRVRVELALGYQARGEWSACLAMCKSMLRDDACEESAHEIAIRTLLLSGNRPGALAQWAEYRAAMRSELGTEPNLELRALIEAVPPPPGRATPAKQTSRLHKLI